MEANRQFSSAAGGGAGMRAAGGIWPTGYDNRMDRHVTPRVAFFGGSFDPPHLGHIGIARAARDALSLDTVLFAPVGAQPLKPEGSAASFSERLEMTRLAIAGEAGFAVSLADGPHPEGRPNYTLDTLRRLRAELPATGELFCLMGADSLAGLRCWHGAAEIPFAATLIVAARPGQELAELAALLPAGLEMAEDVKPAAPAASELVRCTVRNATGGRAPFYLLPHLDFPVSATGIREELRAGRVSALLPAAVAAYIQNRGLYR